jgi:antitoxin MazE
MDAGSGVDTREVPPMRVAVRKWGNSLALRIPRSIPADSRIRDGSVVDVCVAKGNRVVVTPLTRRGYSLDELLAEVTRKNLHGELGMGRPVGREAW